MRRPRQTWCPWGSPAAGPVRPPDRRGREAYGAQSGSADATVLPRQPCARGVPIDGRHRDGASCGVGFCQASLMDAHGDPRVAAVSRGRTHQFSKATAEVITLLTGLGVHGDAHAGVRVQHRSRVHADPTQPNLRQVHLIHDELFHELDDQGYDIGPGQLGENITTHGIDLLALPRHTRLQIGPDGALIEVTVSSEPLRANQHLPKRVAQEGRRSRRQRTSPPEDGHDGHCLCRRAGPTRRSDRGPPSGRSPP